VKPSFWIDQESTENLDREVSESYDKFKEKNITVAIKPDKHRISQLIHIKDLSLGYQNPLFSHINALVRNGEHLFIKGKNGAGKSTLVKTIMAIYRSEKPHATIYEGTITIGTNVRIGEYQQEIDGKYLGLTLEEAVLSVYEDNDIPIDSQKLNSTLSQYLFEPRIDAKQKIRDLSGGQKARFQIIKMLVANPNLLILDEPTNHLDLPSIEELEKALLSFQGGIIYISHDSYFIQHMGGDIIEI
jgi:ATPase subunit of ABC transporter with duplicated ATPase domains